jgi:DUF2075 family protein
MQLFSGLLPEFADEATQNQIGATLSSAYLQWFRRRPSEEEVRSWNNSLVRLKDVLRESSPDDTGVILEYELPPSSARLDCLVCGTDGQGVPRAEILELKQWERCQPAEEDKLVVTWVGGRLRSVPHPSVQVGTYEQFLRDGNSAFYEKPPVKLSSAAYLHNYSPAQDDPLFDPKFEQELRRHPAFVGKDFGRLVERMKKATSNGGGSKVLASILGGRAAPSKQLLRHVSDMITGNPVFTLLDEQLVVYESILTAVLRSSKGTQKECVVVRGGPGTGKSVIAINVMADLSRKNIDARYATGSKAFTHTLRKIVGSRGQAQFNYFNSYSNAGVGQIGAIIADEAHRLRPTSKSRFTPKEKVSNLPQIEELIRAAKTTVFLIDDLQSVVPGEVGSSEYIIEHARRLGAKVSEFDLTVQFRCQGSEGFISWVDDALQLRDSGGPQYKITPSFDFRIFDSVAELDSAIKVKVASGNSGRLVAGYCWPWSDPRPDGTLVDDISIREFSRPWNAKPDAGRLAKGIPRAPLWAYDTGGVNQVGCIYTAQGFEFDYVGVIVGPDLKWDGESERWVGNPAGSRDPFLRTAGLRFTELVKRTYRVLLSRGIKGCYVHFIDPASGQAFEERIQP